MKSNNDNAGLSEAQIFLEELIQNVPPYKTITIETPLLVGLTDLSKVAVRLHCEKCDVESVFNGNAYNFLMGIRQVFRNEMPYPGKQTSLKDSIITQLSQNNFFDSLMLECAKCGNKVYFCFLLDGLSFTKIGQHPSFAALSSKAYAKYKNIIPKKYPELTRSLSAFSQGMGIAAFVYLRRIYEWLVESRFVGPPETKFTDKLNAVEKTEKIVPEELESIKNELYSILSKGVHEYDEDECLEFYPLLQFCVEVILDNEVSKRERALKSKNATKAIKEKLQE